MLHKNLYKILLWAAKNNHLAVVKLLVSSGVKLDVYTGNPFLTAAHYGYLDMLKFFVEQGWHTETMEHTTFIMTFAPAGHDVIKYLKSIGFDVASLHSDPGWQYGP